MTFKIKLFLILTPLIFILPLIGVGNPSEFYFFRLTRVLMSFFTGAGLCLSAYLLQNLTRNPLTSEYTLGISAGASFFASFGFVIGVSPVFFSLFGGVGVTLLLFIFVKDKLKTSSLILLGIVLNIFFSSGISFVNYITSFKASQSLSRWIFGGFSYYDWNEVILAGVFAILIFIFGLKESPKFTLVSISEVYEEILGKSFKRESILILLIIGTFISINTTYAGPIPFYALLFANFVRKISGGHPIENILLSFFGGGFILALLDTLSRAVSPIEEIPIGILTGIIGIPFMGYLIWQERKNG